MKWFHVMLGFLLLALGFGLGLYWTTALTPKSDSEQLAPKTLQQTKVVAQGRILPASGLINIFAPPNQRIASILVQEGQTIAAETELATFTGQATLELQAELVESQGDDAKRELEQSLVAAESRLLAATNSVRAAQLQVEQAQADDSLSAAEKQLDAAREKLTKMEQLVVDPATQLYVSQTNLTDQRNSILQAQSQLKTARQQREHALTAAQLNLEMAQKTQRQAETALNSLRDLEQENRTVELSQSIAETTSDNAKLLAPLAATVLKINGQPGEVMLQSPLMQLGDLAQLVCVAEVIDRLANQVQIGQPVTLSSPALTKPIHGTVKSIGRIVGTGILTDPNPLAVMDRKTVEVKIALDLTPEEIAQQLINLQVTVEIELEPESGSADPGN